VRIVGGDLRGKVLAAPEGRETRPTSDRARESLFNILTHRFQGRNGFSLVGAVVVDAFAGSGALGLEALSRGAAGVTFLETAGPALAALRSNIAACRADAACRVLPKDATRLPARAAGQAPATLVLLDPPYGQGLAPLCLAALATGDWLAPGALVCAETEAPAKGAVSGQDWPAGFTPLHDRSQGKALLTFLTWKP
jgi:16S rRNA (guanine966-N2)-methyltransferase